MKNAVTFYCACPHNALGSSMMRGANEILLGTSLFDPMSANNPVCRPLDVSRATTSVLMTARKRHNSLLHDLDNGAVNETRAEVGLHI